MVFGINPLCVFKGERSMILRSVCTHTVTLMAIMVIFPACTRPVSEQGVPVTEPSMATMNAQIPSQALTGVDELDKIIDIVMSRDMVDLRSRVRFTLAECTLANGLGGPPKCIEGEAEGTIVEVLPFLGPEGHFIRKEDIETWDGLDVSDLLAVYRVSELAYADENYPVGEYAIAFVDREPHTSITLQIRDGLIVRIDYRVGPPPGIREDDVKEYLLGPTNVIQ